MAGVRSARRRTQKSDDHVTVLTNNHYTLCRCQAAFRATEAKRTAEITVTQKSSGLYVNLKGTPSDLKEMGALRMIQAAAAASAAHSNQRALTDK